MDNDLQQWLARARRRWLVSRALDAGGRWAVLPAVLAACIAGTLLLAAQGHVVAVVATCLAGVVGVVATVIVVGVQHSRARNPGAPDWALVLDHHLGLNDGLVTLLDGAGPFAPALAARLAEHTKTSPSRAFVLRPGSLAVALMLALLPLGLVAWQPPRSNNAADQPLASADAPQSPRAKLPSMTGDTADEPRPGTGGQGTGDGARPTGPGRENATGEPRPDSSEPKNIERDPRPESFNPGDGPPQTPPPKGPDEPPPKVDAHDLAIKPEAGEGERRAEERRRWIYDEHGKPVAGAGAAGQDWKARAEEAIPRLKLTTSERKLLEDWFRQVGR